MSQGWIYILISPAMQRDLLKIGRTTNTSEDRARQLSSSTGVPAEFHVAYDVCVIDCITAEKRIHERLRNYRYVKNKEFFKLPLKQAIKIVNEIADQIGVIEDNPLESTVDHQILASADIAQGSSGVSPPVAHKKRDNSANRQSEANAFPSNELDDYAGSRIMRRCGQLGIPYEKVIESPYGKYKGWNLGQFRPQYRDGLGGTVGWGEDKTPMVDKNTTPHSLTEMMSLLGLTDKSTDNDSEQAIST